MLESYEEHHVADVLVMELTPMSPDDERFDAKMTVLIENVTHHMDEEEQDWFPKVRAGLGRKQLSETRRADARAEEDRAPLPDPAERPEEGRRRRHRLTRSDREPPRWFARFGLGRAQELHQPGARPTLLT